ncbi:phage holin [Halobacillus sp. BBL2006]|uniref:phage holin n=1 Tax=Halobacillus sp. BBL2006 TaxID=1543706 RepID=UPI00054397AA|nr:phage holin [Halobacillus sp. BBL2006]KHE73141.1 holin [Halobacillus sp. BBL2006]
MKINWKVRFNNPQVYFQLFLSIFMPILAYMGLTLQDLTTWMVFGEVLLNAVSNPYVLGMVIVSVYNTLIDPTTAGISDSGQAMKYVKPRKGIK